MCSRTLEVPRKRPAGVPDCTAKRVSIQGYPSVPIVPCLNAEKPILGVEGFSADTATCIGMRQEAPGELLGQLTDGAPVPQSEVGVDSGDRLPDSPVITGALELERISIDASSAKGFSPHWVALMTGTNHPRKPSLGAEIARAMP